MAARTRPPRPNAVLTLAGVADQDPTCVHGALGCPGPESVDMAAKCWDCFVGGASS